MVWFVLLHLVIFFVDLVTATRRTDRDKKVEPLPSIQRMASTW